LIRTIPAGFGGIEGLGTAALLETQEFSVALVKLMVPYGTHSQTHAVQSVDSGLVGQQ
jgi:hypothetical protein